MQQPYNMTVPQSSLTDIPEIRNIESLFSTLVTSLKTLESAKRRAVNQPDAAQILQRACEEYCNVSKRTLRSTIQTVDRMVEDYSGARSTLGAGPPVSEVNIGSPRVSRPARDDQLVNLLVKSRSGILAQRVMDLWKMYCISKRLKKAGDMRQKELLSRLDNAERVAESARSELQEFDQRDTHLRDELVRSRAENASLVDKLSKTEDRISDFQRQIQAQAIEHENLKASNKRLMLSVQRSKISVPTPPIDQDSERVLALQAELRQRTEKEAKSNLRMQRLQEEVERLRSDAGESEKKIAQLIERESMIRSEIPKAPPRAMPCEASIQTDEGVSEKVKALEAQLVGEREKNEVELSRIRSVLDRLNDEKRALTAERTALRKNVADLQSQLEESVAAEVTQANIKVAKLRTEKSQLQSQLAEVSAQFSDRISQLESERANLATHTAGRISQLENELSKRPLPSQMVELQSHLLETSAKISQLEKEHAELLKRTTENVSVQSAQTDARISQLEAERAQLLKRPLPSQLADVEFQLAQAAARISQLERERGDLMKRPSEDAVALAQASARIAQLESERSQLLKRPTEEVSGQLAEASARISQLESERAQLLKRPLPTQFADVETKLAQASAKIAELEREREALLKRPSEEVSVQLAQASARISQLETERSQLIKRPLPSQFADVETQLAQASARIAQLERDRGELLKRPSQEVSVQLAQANAMITQLESERAELSKRPLQSQLIDMDSRLAQASAKISQLETERAQLITRPLPSQLADVETQLSQASAKIDQLVRERTELLKRPSEEVAVQLAQASARISQLESERAQLSKRPLPSQLADVETQLAQASGKIDQLVRERNELLKRPTEEVAVQLAQASSKISQLESERVQLLKRPLPSQLVDIETQLSQASAKIDQLVRERTELLKRPSEEVAVQLAQASARIIQLESERAQLLKRPLPSQLADVESQMNQASARISQLEMELSQRQSQLADLGAELLVASAKISQLESELLKRPSESEYSSQATRLQQMESELASTAAQLSRASSQLSALTSERSELLAELASLSKRPTALSVLPTASSDQLKRAAEREVELLAERVTLSESVAKLRSELSQTTARLTGLSKLLGAPELPLEDAVRQLVNQVQPSLTLRPLSRLVELAGPVSANYIGTNKDEDMCGCVMTDTPLPVFPEGVYFEVRVSRTNPNNPDGITVGVTQSVPWDGPPVPNTLDDIPRTWAAGYNGQTWNSAKGEWKDRSWCGKDLAPGQRVGVLISVPPSSQMFVFVDDLLVCRGPNKLPSCLENAYYGLVDLLGNCDAVTLLWQAKPPLAALDLVPRAGPRTDLVPRLSLQPTRELSHPVRPPSVASSEGERA